MDNYILSDESVEIEATVPFPSQYTENAKIMKIKKGTKFINIVNYVLNLFKEDVHRLVIFEGLGDAAEKCISCAEVFKKKYQGLLYQWNSLGIGKSITLWVPTVHELQKIRVTVDTPVMYILISKDPFPDNLQCGSMQCSTEQVIPRHTRSNKNKRKAFPKVETPAGTNRWARSSKEESARRNREKDSIITNISHGSTE